VKDINLLPYNVLEERKNRERTKVFITILVIFGFIGLILIYLPLFKAKSLEREKKAMQAKVDEIKHVVDDKNKLDRIRIRVEQKENLLKEIEKKEVFVKDILELIEKEIPQKIYSVQINVGGSESIIISGVAVNDNAIADLIYNIRGTQKFSDIFVGSIPPTAVNGVNFTINLIIK